MARAAAGCRAAMGRFVRRGRARLVGRRCATAHAPGRSGLPVGQPQPQLMLPMRLTGHAALLVVLLACGPAAAAGDYAPEEVASLGAAGVAQLKPHTIAFTDHRKDDLADPATGLIRFEDWARVRPVQKQFLSLYPAYVEPLVTVMHDGVKKPAIEKLQMYVAEARFIVDKPLTAVDLARYASLTFLEKIDPAISHKVITAADLLPPKEIDPSVHRHPDRAWCEPKPNV